MPPKAKIEMIERAIETRTLFKKYGLPLLLREDVLEQPEFYQRKVACKALDYCRKMENPLAQSPLSMPIYATHTLPSLLSELYAEIRLKLDKQDEKRGKEAESVCCPIM